MKVIRRRDLTEAQLNLIDTIRDHIKDRHLLKIIPVGAIEVGGEKVLLKDRKECSEITWFNTISERSNWDIEILTQSNMLINHDMFDRIGQEAIAKLSVELSKEEAVDLVVKPYTLIVEDLMRNVAVGTEVEIKHENGLQYFQGNVSQLLSNGLERKDMHVACVSVSENSMILDVVS